MAAYYFSPLRSLFNTGRTIATIVKAMTSMGARIPMGSAARIFVKIGPTVPNKLDRSKSPTPAADVRAMTLKMTNKIRHCFILILIFFFVSPTGVILKQLLV